MFQELLYFIFERLIIDPTIILGSKPFLESDGDLKEDIIINIHNDAPIAKLFKIWNLNDIDLLFVFSMLKLEVPHNLILDVNRTKISDFLELSSHCTNHFA